MLVVLLPIFLAETKIIFGYNFIAPINKDVYFTRMFTLHYFEINS